MQRVGGVIEVSVGGELVQAKGSFTYDIANVMQETVVGADRVHGVKVTPKAPYVEGAITDQPGLDVNALRTATNVAVVVRLANGKRLLFHEASHVGDQSGTTEEGELTVRYEAARAEEF